MKKTLTLLLFLISNLGISQQGINYKALLKDASGNVMDNVSIDVEFVILEGVQQTTVYEEAHTTTTDSNGIFILNIGEGTPSTGYHFEDVDWEQGEHYLQVSVDDGNNVIDFGVTKFQTVPYALAAENVLWSKSNNDISNKNSGNVGVGASNPSQKLEVQGKIKIADDGETPEEGTIRYNTSTNSFEGYNGTEWVSFFNTPERSFSISRNIDYTIPSGFGSTNIPVNTIDFNIGDCIVDIGGNNYFSAPVSGRYQLNCTVNIRSAATIGGINADLYVVTGGSTSFQERFTLTRTGNSTNQSLGFTTLINLNVGQRIVIFFSNAGSANDEIIFGGSSSINAFKLSGFLVK